MSWPRHHVGGRLTVAPEHVSDRMSSRLMKKPGAGEDFDAFAEQFRGGVASPPERSSSWYPISSRRHPGSGVAEMIELAEYFLKRRRLSNRARFRTSYRRQWMWRRRMYHTGLDPDDACGRSPRARRRLRERVHAEGADAVLSSRRTGSVVRKALLDAGREDLVGDGPQCLIQAVPPREAVEARSKRRGDDFGRYVHEDEARGAGPADESRGGAGARRRSHRRPPRPSGRRPRGGR